MSQFIIILGQRLQSARKYKGETQQELAEALHISIHSVRAWEQGKSHPSLETIIEICHRYEISADYLLGLSEEENGTFSKPSPHLSKLNEYILTRFEAFLLAEQESNDSFGKPRT